MICKTCGDECSESVTMRDGECYDCYLKGINFGPVDSHLSAAYGMSTTAINEMQRKAAFENGIDLVKG